MKRDIMLSPEHDILIENGGYRLTNTLAEYVAQRLKIILLSIKGEYFLDPESGIPFIDEIFIKGANISDIEAIYIRAIQSVEEVTDITSLNISFSPEDRNIKVSFSVVIENGEEIDLTI